MAKPVDVMVLAAGEGKRMKSPVPKVLVDLLGRTLVGHVVAAARPLRPRRLAVVAGKHLEAIRASFVAEPDVRFALQADPQGTGHAVRCGLVAIPKGVGDLFVLCGDVPLLRPETLRLMLRTHRRAKADVTALTAIADDPTGLGRIVRDARGGFVRIVEEKDADPATKAIREINAGVYVFDSSKLRRHLAKLRPNNAQGEYYLTDVLELALKAEGKVMLVQASDPTETSGINRPSELLRAQGLLHDRLVRDYAEQGVRIVQPSTTHIEVDVEIGPGSVIEPFVVLRKGVRIAARCRVGPFAHLRHGTVLEEGADVGNFVEVKASRLGPGALARHLTYLGDAEVGAGANIGAGVITANFDGTLKHRTRIGAKAFIGSGTVLVAPVSVGAGATTGAGAVVLKGQDVAPGSVVVGVPARPLSGGRTTKSERKPPVESRRSPKTRGRR